MKWWTRTYKEIRITLDHAALDAVHEAFLKCGMAAGSPLTYRLEDVFFDDRSGVLQSQHVTLARRNGEARYCVKYPVEFDGGFLTRALSTRFPYDVSPRNPFFAMGPSVSRALGFGRKTDRTVRARDLYPVARKYIRRAAYGLSSSRCVGLEAEVHFDVVNSYKHSRVETPASDYEVIARYYPDSSPEITEGIDAFMNTISRPVL